MATFVYPTSAEIREVEQVKLPRLIADRPVLKIMPIREVDDHLLVWEQKDNYRGLQQVRGLDGAPTRVKKVGAKRYSMEPGVYGEFTDINETELTRRRKLGSFGEAINISDLVMECQDLLLQRRLDRVEWIIWTLLTTGTFSVASGAGVLHTDTFSIQTFTATVPYSTAATATPLADFRAVKLLGRGKSTNFGRKAQAWMNQSVFNELISNGNAADLYGRRQGGLATINNVDDANKLFMGDDLPEIVIYDEGYEDDSGTFQLFIPNDKIVVVGARPAGAPLGEYRMTRNANNPDLAPGPYTAVVDTLDKQGPPRRIDVHDGHNGGPVLWFPGSIVVMNV